jgi:hypothetical protein
MPTDALQNVRSRFGAGEEGISPGFGKLARKAGVVGVADEKPSMISLAAEHKKGGAKDASYSICDFMAASCH